MITCFTLLRPELAYPNHSIPSYRPLIRELMNVKTARSAKLSLLPAMKLPSPSLACGQESYTTHSVSETLLVSRAARGKLHFEIGQMCLAYTQKSDRRGTVSTFRQERRAARARGSGKDHGGRLRRMGLIRWYASPQMRSASAVSTWAAVAVLTSVRPGESFNRRDGGYNTGMI